MSGLRDEIRQLEGELSQLHRFCQHNVASKPDASPRVQRLAEQQWQEYAQLLDTKMPGLRQYVERRTLERITGDSREQLDIADQEVSRWRMFKSKDYWPALHEQTQGQGSPPASPRGRSGDPTLNAVYDAEYRRLLAQPGRPLGALDKIYADEINRLQRFRDSERIWPEGEGSPTNRGALITRPGSSGKNDLDDIYAREYDRLMRLRGSERFPQEETSPRRALTHSPTAKRNTDLDKIYESEYLRLHNQRLGERIGDNSPSGGQQGSPTMLALQQRRGGSPLDAIYEAEYRRLQMQRLNERVGDVSGGSPRDGGAQYLLKGSPMNDDLRRIYDAEIQRQLLMRAEKAPQLSPSAGGLYNDEFALELDKALLEHHVKWYRRMAAAVN